MEPFHHRYLATHFKVLLTLSSNTILIALLGQVEANQDIYQCEKYCKSPSCHKYSGQSWHECNNAQTICSCPVEIWIWILFAFIMSISAFGFIYMFYVHFSYRCRDAAGRIPTNVVVAQPIVSTAQQPNSDIWSHPTNNVIQAQPFMIHSSAAQ